MAEKLDTMTELRRRLDRAFRPDTASEGFPGNTPSSGHCAAVAAIVHELLGGEMVSTLVEGYSHWINRIDCDGQRIDVDLTGDQFGRPPVQVGRLGELYPGLRVRTPSELTAETLERARLLAQRAGLAEIAHGLSEKLAIRAQSRSRHAPQAAELNDTSPSTSRR